MCWNSFLFLALWYESDCLRSSPKLKRTHIHTDRNVCQRISFSFYSSDILLFDRLCIDTVNFYLHILRSQKVTLADRNTQTHARAHTQRERNLNETFRVNKIRNYCVFATDRAHIFAFTLTFALLIPVRWICDKLTESDGAKLDCAMMFGTSFPYAAHTRAKRVKKQIKQKKVLYVYVE